MINFVIQIEVIEGVRNIQEIVRVPGVDAIFIGPYDLSGSLNKLGKVQDSSVQEAVETVRKTAMDAGLHYVYLGNVPFHDGGNTYCHSCGELLIRRVGYSIEIVSLADGSCGQCHTKIPGVWSQEQALAFSPR